jgi:serralysin
MCLGTRALWLAGLLIVCGLYHAPAHGFGHLWHFTEAYSNSSGSVQFIEMHTDAPGEFFIQGLSVRSNGNTFVFPSNLSGSTTAEKRLLLATAGFASLPGGVQPDFTIPANFFSPFGDTLVFNAFGDVDSFTFTSTQFPRDGVLSLNAETRVLAPNSPTNFAGTTGHVTVPEPAGAALVAGTLLALVIRRR